MVDAHWRMERDAVPIGLKPDFQLFPHRPDFLVRHSLPHDHLTFQVEVPAFFVGKHRISSPIVSH
ncbi:uncharacterized protein METZ01_LOCUS187959 [marine metagenome]|uniref:Uncharacterized protein n=1 Tax=marine metagenome TaxID=408172 RepID=A0A382DA05_9ZZZZ